ncbi:MAG: tyrosine-type recombinase/integrase [Chloroflexota bacterium]|nr:tyrosine-type recombinase/integrase [Chloroflexota bacterium]
MDLEKRPTGARQMVSAAWSDGVAPGGRHRLCDRRTQQPEWPVALGPAYEAGDLVFATAVGRPLNPNNVLRPFAALVRTARVPRVWFHDLQHTYATWLLMDGQPVKVVS